MSRVRTETAGGVARITLARPEKKNALDQEMVAALLAAVRASAEDGAVRAVLLDAEGSDFCAGADLEALAGMVDAAPEVHRKDAELLGQLFVTLRTHPRPVVAAVRGRALAGGTGLATACDIVLAHEAARFGFPEVIVGFVPAMVMTMLRRSVGEKRAFELVASGRSVTAHEALELGLVSRVFAAADFDAGVEKYVSDLAARSPDALRITKHLFHALDTRTFEAGIAIGAQANVEARGTAGFREGVAKFTKARKDP